MFSRYIYTQAFSTVHQMVHCNYLTLFLNLTLSHGLTTVFTIAIKIIDCYNHHTIHSRTERVISNEYFLHIVLLMSNNIAISR